MLVFQKLWFTNLRNIFERHQMSVIVLSRSAARRLMCTNVSQQIHLTFSANYATFSARDIFCV